MLTAPESSLGLSFLICSAINDSAMFVAVFGSSLAAKWCWRGLRLSQSWKVFDRRELFCASPA